MDVHHVPAMRLRLPDEYRHPSAGLQRPGAVATIHFSGALAPRKHHAGI